ncbi:adenosine kinase [Pterulicium gracile]|uniref:Adenosine kinase n=1 Tax=Pterulicium gracile TaxID=1884261 RepID=A0A5C3QHH6_9AGAR|nr:adenosine kinase [Pterula gracilis]
MSYKAFFIGNPLLDIQVNNGEAILEKYNLKSNDAILAEEKHIPIYEEITKSDKVIYVAGGAAQNAARAAAYNLPAGTVVYTGCVGDDDLAEQLKAANRREGVDEVYQVKKGEQTGACAAIITGHDRSLVTTLRAAEMFEQSHLSSPEVSKIIDGAQLFYVGGFFLTHGVESVKELGQKASAAGKIFSLNFSAPFIPQFFKAQLESVIPFTDFIFGNESEAEAYASANGLSDTKDIAAIARSIAVLPKSNPSRPRVVVFTQGADSTIVVSSAEPDAPKVFKVTKLTNEQIVDTNGAGDAFAGGFLAALVAGKPVEEAVEAGHKMGAMCVGQVGPTFKWPKAPVF